MDSDATAINNWRTLGNATNPNSVPYGEELEDGGFDTVAARPESKESGYVERKENEINSDTEGEEAKPFDSDTELDPATKESIRKLDEINVPPDIQVEVAALRAALKSYITRKSKKKKTKDQKEKLVAALKSFVTVDTKNLVSTLMEKADDKK